MLGHRTIFCYCAAHFQGLLELFVTRPLKTGSEVIKAVLAPEKAAAARDGFAQLVYSCLFSWLIARVNESLQPPPQPCAVRHAHAKLQNYPAH